MKFPAVPVGRSASGGKTQELACKDGGLIESGGL